MHYIYNQFKQLWCSRINNSYKGITVDQIILKNYFCLGYYLLYLPTGTNPLYYTYQFMRKVVLFCHMQVYI